MTPAEIAERWAKVTPGRWVAYPDCSEESGTGPAHVDTDAEGVIVECYSESARANVIAIAHAPQDVAALLGEIAKMREAYEAVERLRLARAAHVAADDAWIAAGRPPMLLRDGNRAEHPTIDAFYETLTAREDARAKLIALTSASAPGVEQ